MTIEKGKEWGRPGITPSDCVVAPSDAALGLSQPGSFLIVTGGDMFEALGRPQQRSAGEPCTEVLIDSLQCEITHSSGEVSRKLGVSYVSFGYFLHGEFTMISNSGFWKGRHIAPRSHPNDGQFDVVSFANAMSTRQRCIAFNKMKTSTHIPHPNISSHRGTVIAMKRTRRLSRCVIDGVALRDWQSVTVTLVPDYWTVIL